jgi:hypothetical protein
MDLDSLFSAASAISVVGWLFLVFVPRKPYTQAIAGAIAPLILAVIYLTLIFSNIRGAEGGFGSLADVATLFQKRELLLAGWIHYLAFDLFIGAWETRDAARNQIPHLVVIPCLLMTFMLGPIGLLFYFAIRAAKTRNFAISSTI